jgi:hypothetical protein
MSLAPRSRALALALAAALVLGRAQTAGAQEVRLDLSEAGRGQTLEGFGTALYGTEGQETWFHELYFDDLRASIVRIALVPRFVAPYSDFTYNSPWFHRSPALPGPDGNNVRRYTGPGDYSAVWAGRRAPIAVMGPNIDANVRYFDFDEPLHHTAGVVARAGQRRAQALGGFKVVGSLLSPPPWVKESSGNAIAGQSGILPVNGTPWPFIWFDNFAGGQLDVSDEPLAVFDDSSLGGKGPTSALTQFKRSLAAYLRGLQEAQGFRFHAISIQNELNFETNYNSCLYRTSEAYLAALRAARSELDRYDDLRQIRIMGPEDLLGSDGYALWQYGDSGGPVHKNLQLVRDTHAKPADARMTDFFAIHGYAPDGVSAAGANPNQWRWWADGWTASPGLGLPEKVRGFKAHGKPSWMTETSGEHPEWLWPTSGFPGEGALGVALRMHQALVAGEQSAWIYWQMSDGESVSISTLTDGNLRKRSPKYVAAKHYFRFIRPGAVRIPAEVRAAPHLLASAFVHDSDDSLTVVLINTHAEALETRVTVPPSAPGPQTFDVYTSEHGRYFERSEVAVKDGTAVVAVPGYGVVTLAREAPGSASGLASGAVATSEPETSSAALEGGSQGRGARAADPPQRSRLGGGGLCGCILPGDRSFGAGPGALVLALLGAWVIRARRVLS